ncbi:MAG: hypothetical protein KDB50_01445 [Mycobacterium sp.]|nr:hypothetical protein [Mycobacterium sp.]
MLIVALVLAVIGLAALVTAVVSSNEVVAWVCIGASALGVILLVVDAVRDRQRRATTAAAAAETATETTEIDVVPDVVPDEVPTLAEVPEVATVPAEGGDTTEAVTAEGDDTTETVTVGTDPVTEQQAEVAAEIDGGAPDAGDVDAAPELSAEDHPEEVIHDEPEFDTFSDDEPEYPPPAEESAMHTVGEPDSDATGER